MYVKCIKPHPGVIESGYYTVKEITKNDNFILNEICPPSPHTSFSKDRFEEINIDDINIYELTEIFEQQYN